MIRCQERCRVRLAGALLLAATVLMGGCAFTRPPPGVAVVSSFDVRRYQGRWFEVARLDHWFERGLTDVSASYASSPDGSLLVVNRGYDSYARQWREVKGKAWFTGSPTTASLRVSFFGPVWGGYHVVALDEDYRWAVVVGPDLGYCWILARDWHLDAAVRDAVIARARALGIDTDALLWVRFSFPT